jgi:hypothetical protein
MRRKACIKGENFDLLHVFQNGGGSSNVSVHAVHAWKIFTDVLQFPFSNRKGKGKKIVAKETFGSTNFVIKQTKKVLIQKENRRSHQL